MSIDLEMEEILKVFFEESEEGLSAMESGLLTLGAANCSSNDVVNTIFRAAHSIKGGAGTFGFMEISEFTHAVETLLDEMRTGRRAVSPQGLHLLLQSVDVIRGMLDSVQAKQPIDMSTANALSANLTRLLAEPAESDTPTAAPQATANSPATAEVAAASPAMESRPAAPAPAPALEVPAASGLALPQRWRIRFSPDASVFKTCNDPARIFAELALLGDLAVSCDDARLPDLGTLDPTVCYLAWTLKLDSDAEEAQLRELFDWVDANSSIFYERIDASRGGAASAGAVSAAASSPGVATASARSNAPVAAVVPSAASTASAAGTATAATAAGSKTAVPAKAAGDAGSIRVATEKVDALINLVGELVITQSMLGRFAEGCEPDDLELLRRGLTQLSRNTRELQESVMAIRMLPIGFSFNRFPRLVHDLSRKLGKKVELRIKGENTELDKTVLEKIGDPLVHLVRNSLDHGLELPQVRIAAGKPETGVLELHAFHEGGSIVIEVRDDGAGLNTQRILAKARERGLVQAGEPLSDEQIHALIFEAGFSTAEAVSDISGRGVGMDVVKRNIADLGGHVQIDSLAGRGSTIRIRLPLTLAILDAQMLRVGKETYVVSLVAIIETLQPLPAQISSVIGQTELFMHRGDYIPIIRLHERFDIEPDSCEIAQGLLVVVEADGRRAAILVDELLAQQQVVIKSLETNFRQVPGVAGATIHGDGTVALILDVPGLVTHHLKAPARRIGRAA